MREVRGVQKETRCVGVGVGEVGRLISGQWIEKGETSNTVFVPFVSAAASPPDVARTSERRVLPVVVEIIRMMRYRVDV